jgi:hypothetical protein
MEKAYLIKKGGNVIAHRDLSAMKQLDGIAKPDKIITIAEWEAAGGMARLINGTIFLGKTAEEKQAEANQARLIEIQRDLDAIDAKSGRASRSVALAISKGEQPASGDIQRLTSLEAEAAALREEKAGIA